MSASKRCFERFTDRLCAIARVNIAPDGRRKSRPPARNTVLKKFFLGGATASAKACKACISLSRAHFPRAVPARIINAAELQSPGLLGNDVNRLAREKGPDVLHGHQEHAFDGFGAVKSDVRREDDVRL